MIGFIESLTLGDIVRWAPVPFGVYFGWRLFRILRTAFTGLERMPTKAVGAVLALAALTLGPVGFGALWDTNAFASFGVGGGSLFGLVMGLLMIARGGIKPDLSAEDSVVKLALQDLAGAKRELGRDRYDRSIDRSDESVRAAIKRLTEAARG